jgi:hypothetical protein
MKHNINVIQSVWRRIRRPSKSTMEQIRKLEIAPVSRQCSWQPQQRLCVRETGTLSYGSPAFNGSERYAAMEPKATLPSAA